MFEAQSKEGLIYSSLLGFLPFRFTFREFLFHLLTVGNSKNERFSYFYWHFFFPPLLLIPHMLGAVNDSHKKLCGEGHF
jgi:hypothetical protein